ALRISGSPARIVSPHPFFQVIGPSGIQTAVAAPDHICVIHIRLLPYVQLCKQTSAKPSIVKQSIKSTLFTGKTAGAHPCNEDFSIANFLIVYYTVFFLFGESYSSPVSRYITGSTACPSFVMAK